MREILQQLAEDEELCVECLCNETIQQREIEGYFTYNGNQKGFLCLECLGTVNNAKEVEP